MPFSVEDKHTIEVLRQHKRYETKRLIRMFPKKRWSLGGLKTLLNKLDAPGSIERRQRIVEEWEQLGQPVIDNAIRRWRRRLRGCIDAV